jgi:hypothetical protein
VGNLSYEGATLQFAARQAANVLLWRTGGTLRVLSTADVSVRLNLASLLPEARTGRVALAGRCGAHACAEGWLTVELLEGERIEVTLAG